MEAEYIALSQAMRDLIPIWETVKEIYNKVFKKQLTPKCTAQSKMFPILKKKHSLLPQSMKIMQHVCSLTKMPKMSPHTNHIGLPHRWFLGKLSSLEIGLHGVSSNYQLADQFTKFLCREKFEKARFYVLGWWTLFCVWEEDSIKRTVKLCFVVEMESQEK